MNDRQAAEMVKVMIGALNERIARLEEENARLREELQTMTKCVSAHDEARTNYLDRLLIIHKMSAGDLDTSDKNRRRVHGALVNQ